MLLEPQSILANTVGQDHYGACTMNLQPLFEPSSIAVLGASTRPSVGGDMIETLKRFGFSGAIYPVNPKYDTLLDLPC